MFTELICEAQKNLEEIECGEALQIAQFDAAETWPLGSEPVILTAETAVEVGPPSRSSVAITLWTEKSGLVHDGRIRLYGPDLTSGLAELPLAKIVFVEGEGFTDENAYERFRELDRIKFNLQLKGYALRAAPQENKEWARVSRTALNAGLSMRLIGNEIIRRYHEFPYVKGVEVAFVTISDEAVAQFAPMGKLVGDTLRAMNKMKEKLDYDCASCDFKEVCNEVEGLRRMHKRATEA